MQRNIKVEKSNKNGKQIIKWGEWENSEKPALCLLKEIGYTCLNGKYFTPENEKPERKSLRDVILRRRLMEKIKQFNPWINESNISKIIRKLTIPTTSSNIEFNRELWGYLTKPHTLTVEQDVNGKGRRQHSVKLIEWDPKKITENDFLCVNQFKINSSRGNCIPDIMIFVNGLPVVMIECKSPTTTKPLEAAIHQVMKYQNRISRAFYLNQFIIITAGQSARYGVVENSYSNYRKWVDPYPITPKKLEEIIVNTGRSTVTANPQDRLIYGMLEPKNLLNLIRNFIVYEVSQGKLIKKVARYQQFRAVNRTIEKVLDSKERGGTIWHAQGSGKSLTMLFTALKLRREEKLKNPLLVFVTDRVDLASQLNETFNACGFQNAIQPKNASELQNLIKIGQGVTIFTTIQKFRVSEVETDSEVEHSGTKFFPILNESENIFVLVDEAHRSNYKIFAMRMRKSMPNAFYLAYTGTPLARTEKNEKITVGKGKTVRKFGSFIDTYGLRQSIADGSTVQILYKNRMPEMLVEGYSLDEIYERIFADKTSKEREAIKKRYITKEAVLSADDVVRKKALDILKHYEEYVKPNGFKAQIVTSTREAAVKYKKFLDKLHAPESVVIISANRLYDDELEDIAPFVTNKTEQKKYIERFKRDDDPLSLLIVCDMLITGFDAPIEQVMYLDKSLREHNLLQAIARVNRRYKNKWHGLIVDYFGISLKLEEALEIFYAKDVEGVMLPIDSELPRLEEYHRAVMQVLNGLDQSDVEAIVLAFEDEQKRAELQSAFRLFAQSLDIILPDPRAERYITDLKLLVKIIRALRVRYRDEQLNIAGCGEKIKEIINDHIRTAGIIELVKPISIFSKNFQEQLDQFKNPKSSASEITHAIKHEINIRGEEDPEFYMGLKDQLEIIIEMYREQRIDLAEKIKMLKSLAKDIKTHSAIAEQMGLNPAELALFNICKREMKKLGIGEDQEIFKATHEILDGIEPWVNIVDWKRKSDIRRQMRVEIKKVLKTKNESYTRKELDEIAHEIVKLATIHYSY